MGDDITKRIAHFIEAFRVKPGSHVTLAEDFDPAFKAGIDKKKDGVGLLNDGIALLSAAIGDDERVRGVAAWRRGVDRTLGLVEPEPVAARAT